MSLLRRLRQLLVALLALGAVGGGVWVFGFSELVRYREIRVVGNQRVSEVAVRHLADLPEGAPLVTLDLPHAVANIERHPWVAHATARRVFPDTVVIQVEERQVAALLLLDALYLVDTEGKPFRKADAQDLHHPLLTGISPDLAEREPALARRLIAEGLALLTAAQGHGGLRADDISEVRFDAGSGYTLALRNGGEVLLGFTGPEALPRLDALATAGVDLSHPHRVDLGLAKMAVVTPL